MAGDRWAFGELVEKYRQMIYGFGYHLTGEFESARDLAQEAFIQAYLKLDHLREPDKFVGWLRQIALNVYRVQARKHGVMTVALAEDDGESALAAYGEVVALKPESAEGHAGIGAAWALKNYQAADPEAQAKARANFEEALKHGSAQ